MMTQATAQKGRLERLLDDFTDVHGTVLLGMHKELQTLRKDVDTRVEARLVEFLAQVSAAESGVRKQMETSQELCTRLQELTAHGEVIAQGLADFADGSSKAMRDARDSALADIGTLAKRIVQERAKFMALASGEQQRVLQANDEARKRMSAAVAVSIEALDERLAQASAAFTHAASEEQQRVLQANNDARQRMSAAVAVANAMNHESQALIQQAREQQASLHRRELQLQKGTRQLAVGVGLVILLTLGFWIWLTLTH